MQAEASRVNKLKVVLDTNIYVSATFWDGKPYRIVQKALNNEFSVFVSEDIKKEFKRVLARDFELIEKEIDENINYLFQFASIVEPKEKVSVIKDDPDDDRILECALSSQSNYIVTQDNHLLKINEFRGIKIINPKDFLDIVK
jgi:putative PIN family toxin of toxin-antitoxin system